MELEKNTRPRGEKERDFRILLVTISLSQDNVWSRIFKTFEDVHLFETL